MTTETNCFLRKPCRKRTLSSLLLLTVLSAILFFASSQILWAASEAEDSELSIVSDGGEMDLLESSYTYTGNVVITSGPTRITADYVKCYFKQGIDTASATDASAIDKLTASGNVVIVTENGIANANEAVYDSQTRSMVLTGEPVIVEHTEKNVVTRCKTLKIQNYNF